MCIKCEIEKAVLEAAGKEKVTTVIGTMGRGFIKELTQLDEADEKLQGQVEEEMKRRLKEEEVKLHDVLQEELGAKYGKKWDELKALQRKVYGDALASIGAELGQDYEIDKVSGEVTHTEIRDKAAAK